MTEAGNFGYTEDGIIAKQVEEYNTTYKSPESTWVEEQIIIFNPEQGYILGSKQDVERFKEFVRQPTRPTSEVVNNKKELAEELNSLTKELKELMGDISPQINLKEESVFEYISDLTLIEDTKLKNSKEAELKKNFGEDNVERANAINANFDTIIEEINKSGINIFFDPKTNKHQNGCD